MPSNQTFTVTFVCSGNICRSPMAEVIAADAITAAGLASQVTVDSAGLGDWHVGESADVRAMAALGAKGFDGSAHVARVFDATEFDATRLVVALDDRHYDALARMRQERRDTAVGELRMLRSFDPTAPAGASVPDPYYGTNADFDAVLCLIDAAMPGLVAYLRSRCAPLGVPSESR